jgi:hypothetical protein
MRVEVHPADGGGCGTYRLIWPAQVLRDEGHDIVLREPGAALQCHREKGPLGDRLRHVELDADVLVLQRPLAVALVDLIPQIQSQGVAVVVEVDDDFHALPKGHPARRGVAPATNPHHNRRWLALACERADLVTVSTPALAARYGAHGRVCVIENQVPAAYLAVPRVDGGSWGWTGSTATHVRDLCVMGDTPGRLIDQGLPLHVIGTGDGVDRDMRLAGREFSTTGWVEIDRYPHEYARLAAAVVPLEANPFNDAKSWLKGAEAAALGVPFVASPTAEYRRLAQAGVGLLADTPAEWFHALEALLGDPAFADEIAGRGVDWAEQHTYESQAWRWAEAWAQALANRRGTVAA